MFLIVQFLQGFLFLTSKPPANQTLEEQQLDESDVKVVELIRDQIMPFAAKIPKEFLLQTVSLLNKGSIDSATNSLPVGKLHYFIIFIIK